MKVVKRLLIITVPIILIAALLIAYFSMRFAGAKKGMTLADFQETKAYSNCIYMDDLIFYKNAFGDHVVMYKPYDRMQKTSVITEMKCMPGWLANPTDKKLSSIHEGMTIYEVVRIAGLPCGTNSSGVTTYVFQSNSGNYYSVWFAPPAPSNSNIYTVNGAPELLDGPPFDLWEPK